ncbi:reverse transcriptase [Phytophthora megakarya]|uniref:Reverse transcriptase n=1 Tax=Phytophthora megakarya TaxID=4795 RepID=A0A225URN6_9STRA|nr:reverse transcriptase [Phytophthora megakarya]
MSKSTIYSALDLIDGFYQLLMRESDIPLTAVSTPSGMLWEWLVMPQGLKNAPATFNRCVTHLLRSYVDNYAGKIRPLSQLLKKEAAWKWTAECQQAFDAVKLGLTEAPILAVADQDRPFHVVCDASDFAIGCALMQLDHEGLDRVVYYQSRQLNPAERNYPVHDKELLAMKYALAKFRVYLLGNTPFVVYTDHASLRTTVKSSHISQRMMR